MQPAAGRLRNGAEPVPMLAGAAARPANAFAALGGFGGVRCADSRVERAEHFLLLRELPVPRARERSDESVRGQHGEAVAGERVRRGVQRGDDAEAAGICGVWQPRLA